MRVFYLLFITIFLLNSSVFLHSEKAGVEYIKLEKVAVSNFPEDIFIPGIGSFSIDKAGNVFVFVGKSNREGCFVAKLDPNLKFIKKIGGEGQGPGEYSTRLSSNEERISLDSAGVLYVKDFNPTRLLVFDNDGNYKKEYRIIADYMKYFGYLSEIISLDGTLFIGRKTGENTLPPQFLLINLLSKQVVDTYTFEGKVIYLDGFHYSWFCYGHNWLVDTDVEAGLILLSECQVYKVRLYDKSFNLKLEIFDKKRKMGSFSREEMMAIIKYNTPKNINSVPDKAYLANPKKNKAKYNQLTGIIEESKNVIADARLAGDRIYIFPVPEDISIKERFPVEIYDLKGKLLKKALFKEIPKKIWRNFVFFIELDEDDNPYIVKYRMLDIP